MTLKIAVSALHRGENPQPGSAVIDSIRRLRPDATIIGLSYDPLDSGLYTPNRDFVDQAYLMPYPNKGSEAMFDRIHEIHREWTLDVIIPNTDQEIPHYVEIKNALKTLGIRVAVPTTRALERRDKGNLYQLCRSVSVRSPNTVLVNDARDAQDAAEAIGFPVMLKGRMYGAVQANSPSEVPPIFHRLRELWGGHVLVQALIESKDEYSIVGLGDGQGNVVASCAIRKIILTSIGKTFSGVVIRNDEMQTAAARIVKTLRWMGPFEIEFIAGKKGMEVIEMNPRFPSWIDFPSQIGCNMPSALVDMLMGITPKVRDCEAGKLFVRHCIDLAGDISQVATLIHKGVLKCTNRPQ